MKLVVGLGNPGTRYTRTRHNLGFVIVDHLAKLNEVTIKRKFCGALVGEGSHQGKSILFVKPRSYMNRSGEPIKELLARFRARAEDLVVVYDDLDLPFGRIRIRAQGSAGGHRGMLSVMEALGGAAFCRVRVGIGRPPKGADPVDYVLEPFNAQETSVLADVIARAGDAVMSLLRDGSQRAMERFNRAS